MSHQPRAESELEPPWAAYPWIPHGSIGWRMGCGEDYLQQWFPHVGEHIRDFPSALAYLQRHPRAPRTWALFLMSWLQPLAQANPRRALRLDPASWRGYLARWPPPPAWQAVVARDPYRALDRTLR